MDDRQSPPWTGPHDPEEAPMPWRAVPATPAQPGPQAPPEARKPRGTIGWDILLGFDLVLIGLAIITGIFAYLWFLSTGEPVMQGDAQTGPSILWFNNVLNLVMYGMIPFVWVLGTRVDAWEGALRYLGLVRPWPSIAQGVGYGALLSGLAIVLFIGLDAVDFPVEDTGGGVRFMGITWGLVVVTALIAGFAEELFFRGILQKWIGVWGQAVVFGSLHLANGWLAFLVTSSIGLLFGYLVKRGRSLWLVIAAHASYNMVLLGITVFADGNEAVAFLMPLL